MKKPLAMEGGNERAKRHSLNVLEDTRKLVEEGKIVSVVTCVEDTNGTVTSTWSHCENRLVRGARLIKLGLADMGFISSDRSIE